MPVLDWLSASTSLSGRILTPIQTRTGAYKIETDCDVCVLFLFVNGTVPSIHGITVAQTAELADLLACLHNIGGAMPISSQGLDEDIALPFCGQLAQFIESMSAKQGALFALLSPHVEILRFTIQQCLHLRDTVRAGYTPLVLCHGDAHGNNVIQSERLVLADWEDLRLAPAEADLFIYAWHPHGDAFLEAYSAARKGYPINRELLYFYVLRRRIEDIWVDIERITEEAPDESEAAKLREWILLGIDEIRNLIQSPF
jgi:aminoglycoside phosphotransferase (APT) family kinase protein